MTIRLALLTALEVAGVAVALIYYLYRIVTALERIGGTGESYLAKIRFGVRAIEKQTSHIAPEVTRLNQSLTTIAGKLEGVDAQLQSSLDALSRGKEPSP